ncbi:MAG: biotin/lipoyl-binding protein, partial [Bacteroidaceae bacterium]|nr:biotin/lipoyl-binding protein [Bacteroidaceae bacterium]
AAAPAANGAGEGTPVKAPLPGVVTQVKVAVGQAVKKGDTVAVLEAMKMENNIAAETDGTVSGIAVAPGESVLEGAVLVTIA